jgi:hypothetical protein
MAAVRSKAFDGNAQRLKWCRRGKSNHDRSLKTRKLLILQNAKNDKIYKNADNWNVSGTHLFNRGARREDKLAP